MLIVELFAFAVIGMGAGFIAGLLGMSGGIVTVPCLFLTFTLLKFPSTDLMQLAMGTSLAAMVFNAISATYSHHQDHAVNWKLVKTMLPGLILGCIAGAFVGYLLPGTTLQLIFGIFAVVLGVYIYRRQELPDLKPQPLPSKQALNGVGFGVGALSNILGIGGGTMMVPVFIGYKIPMKIAIGSSAATGFFISLAGAVSYLIFGLGKTYDNDTIGYIYLPAFAILAVATFFTAPFGARMSHRMASDKLKKYFAICLIAVGIFMSANAL